MYKNDLSLNNQPRLICYKSHQTKVGVCALCLNNDGKLPRGIQDKNEFLFLLEMILST